MHKHTHRWLTPQILGIALLCMSASFGAGITMTGEVQTISHTNAEETVVIAGDMNGDAVVNMRDVIELLEIARGYKVATVEQLKAEPDGDGAITIDDAIRLLYDLQPTSL